MLTIISYSLWTKLHKNANKEADSVFNDGLYENLCNKDNTAFLKRGENAFALVTQNRLLMVVLVMQNIGREFSKYFNLLLLLTLCCVYLSSTDLLTMTLKQFHMLDC